MRQASPYLPEGCVVYNFMFETLDPDYLDQDQFCVRLPNGIYIDVSWWPEHDVEGHYCIHVFKEFWDDQLEEPFEVDDFDLAVSVVEVLAWEYV